VAVIFISIEHYKKDKIKLEEITNFLTSKYLQQQLRYQNNRNNNRTAEITGTE